MPHELQFFENLIAGIILEKEINLPEGDWVDVLRIEKELFLLRMYHRSCEAISEEEIRICIREHQRAISHLSFLLDNHDGRTNFHDAKEMAIKLATVLNDLMFSLQQGFPHFFSKEEQIKGTILRSVTFEMKQQQETIQQSLFRAGMDESFIKCLMTPLNELLMNSEKQLTWHYYHYYKALFREINHLLDTNSNREELQYALWRCMIYFNFNAYSMFDYAKQRCKEILANLDTENEKQQYLLGWIKKFGRCHVLPGIALRQNRESLAVQITNWLTVEKEFMIPEEYSERRKDSIEMLKPIEKPRVSLSVPRFAYLIRLLVQCSIFNAKHLTVVLRVFCTHFATQRSEMISLQSMRTHYYEPDRSTVHAIRDLLYNMLQQSKKDYP